MITLAPGGAPSGWGQTETIVMKTKLILAVASLLAAPIPAFAVSSGPGPDISCQAVRANPSLYARHVVSECRRMGWNEPMGYAGAGGGGPIQTRNSSCGDVRERPALYSEDVREACAASDPRGPGDWGGSIVR
jgi:hypothetical protein